MTHGLGHIEFPPSLEIIQKWRYDIKHNDTLHNDNITNSAS
jgi:hypothetical protein